MSEVKRFLITRAQIHELWNNAKKHHESEYELDLGETLGFMKLPMESDHLAAVQALEARVRELEEFAESVVRWSESYPTDIFTEPTPKQIDDVCKLSGFRIDMISAMVLREFTKSWGNKARSALTRKPQ